MMTPLLKTVLDRIHALPDSPEVEISIDAAWPADTHSIDLDDGRITVTARDERCAAHALGRILRAGQGNVAIPSGRFTSPFRMRIAEGQFPFYPWQFCVGSLAGDWHDFPLMEFRYAMKSSEMKMTKYGYNAIENAAIRFDKLLQELVLQGYNGVTLADVLHAIDYTGLPHCDRLPDATRQSLDIYNTLYARIVPMVADYGLDLYFYTDELVFPEAFAEARDGHVRLDDSELWHFVGARYRRLFEMYPTAAGVMDRFGEQYETAGFTGIRVDKYDGAAWGEASLVGKTREAVKRLQNIIIKDCGKRYLHRTWDLGFDKVHANPDNQEAIFAGLEHPDFYVLNKINIADFQPETPFNPAFGRYPNQIAEFQCKMEHMAMSELPSFMGETYAAFLKQHGRDLAGAWVWFYEGGHTRNNRYPLFAGFAKWTEANIEVMRALLENPEADPYEAITPWVTAEWGAEATPAMLEILRMSYDCNIKLLLEEHAYEDQRKDGGLDMYLLRWHNLFPEQLELVYTRNQDRFEAMLDRKQEAVDGFKHMEQVYAKVTDRVPNRDLAHATLHSIRDAVAFAELVRNVWETAFLVQADMAGDPPREGHSLRDAFKQFEQSFETYSRCYNTFDASALFLFAEEVRTWIERKQRFNRVYEKSDDMFKFSTSR